MDKISKMLQKLNGREKDTIKSILNKLIVGDFCGLDIKKLKSQDGIYRARKGDLRVIYRINEDGRATIIDICRRNDNTYKILFSILIATFISSAIFADSSLSV